MQRIDAALRVPLAALAIALLAMPAAAQEDAPCLMCHGEASNFKGQPDSASLVVTREMFEGSVHGEAGMPCTSCHAGLKFPHPEDPPVVNCSACHSGIAEEYEASLHGYALSRGNTASPTCIDCHGVHDILHSTDPRSKASHANTAKLCAECHSADFVRGTNGELAPPRIFEAFESSVHGLNEDHGAANCTDCHGVHDMRGHSDANSKVHRSNVAETCGACHAEVRANYEASIHGRAFEAGYSDSPTCTDCHGEHHILSHEDPDARTSDAHMALDLCADCHNDPEIIQKYGLEEGVVGSYVDSYHGWATRLDHGHVATCVSCHTAHEVLPAEDPASTVSEQNVVATCQECHPGSDRAFAESYDHISASIETNPVNRILRTIYIWLIVGVIGGMLVHNAIIMFKYLRDARRRHVSEPSFVRLTRSYILQHVVLVVSFIVLVITGFALRYIDAWWVQALASIGFDEIIRSTIHRVAGVVLIVGSIWHIIWIALYRHGRRFIRDMAPRPSDLSELATNVGYHLGVTKKPARFARFGYIEKAEYWALVWGTALMAITGIVLWFPAEAVEWAPAWIVAASQTIHFYEAWLATLAIIVWHFFFVIFHPDAYPLSFVAMDGRMSEEDARHHHPRWYEAEKEAEAVGETTV
ncbi:MAG: cytochrome c3 family protein [marine benthic group bacterium]|nr:cytochrome c3 family protein [Gemmatimonadota bacterium]